MSYVLCKCGHTINIYPGEEILIGKTKQYKTFNIYLFSISIQFQFQFSMCRCIKVTIKLQISAHARDMRPDTILAMLSLFNVWIDTAI